MRYGIFADIHSNLEALEAVIEAYKKESIDRYFCAGDIVGYAANPGECIEKVSSLAGIAIAGNHDWAAVDLFPDDYFNPAARQALAWTRGNLGDRGRSFLKALKLTYSNNGLVMAHGTLEKPQDFNYISDGYMAEKAFRLMEVDICFVAHTHVPGIYIKDSGKILSYTQDNQVDIRIENKYIVNVGSVGQPRDGNPDSAYCIYDSVKRKVQIKRVSYNTEITRKKIIDAGLPKFLGDRLLTGM